MAVKKSMGKQTPAISIRADQAWLVGATGTEPVTPPV